METSLLDYHAAHAPEVPEWFEPTIRQRPYPPMTFETFKSQLSEEDRYMVTHYWDDEGDCWAKYVPKELEDKVKYYFADWAQRSGELKHWKQDYEVQRIVQWRRLYAIEMINALAILKQ